jgi:hypothetical protein
MKTVERGAAYLDEVEPEWAERVDPYALDMSQCHRCVLGQLDGDYDNGLTKRGLSERDALRLGFLRWPTGTWARLSQAWREAIKARR